METRQPIIQISQFYQPWGRKRLPPSLILVTVQNHSLLDAFTFPLIFYHCKFSQQIKTPTIGTFDILFSTVFDTVLLYFL
jgi:hypothetical protein